MSAKSDMAGAILDERYKLVTHVGTGRFGDLWKAERLHDGGIVGIKLFQPNLFENREAISRFERETALLRGWEHPNLLRVLDHGRTHTGHSWLVTEFLEGRFLREEMGRGLLTVEAACHVAEQVATVLAAAHARGIVHRGLDPDAIWLVERQGDPYGVFVLDFGLAHVSPREGEEALTGCGQRVGRPEYMAPEYIGESRLDARSDLYALGILLFEMLAGRPPFTGRPQAVLMSHLGDDPPPPSQFSSMDVPAWLDELVAALLRKEPEARPQDALSVAERLRAGR